MEATCKELTKGCGLDFQYLFRQGGRWLVRAALKPVKTVRAWNRVQKDTRTLLNMSDHLLKDIGVSKEDLIQEIRRRNW